MVKKITSILPLPSFVFIILCSLGILGFILLIFLNQKADDVLDTRIKQIQLKTEERKVLTPLYDQLKRALQTSEQIQAVDLPFSKSEKLNHLDMQLVQSTFNTIIQESGLKTEKIEPDLTSIIDDSDHIRIHTAMTGDFMDFRTVMLRLCEQIPSIKHIQQMQIEPIEDTEQLRLSMEIWLAKK